MIFTHRLFRFARLSVIGQLVIFLIGCSQYSFGQISYDGADSSRARPVLKFDNRFSILDQRQVSMIGFKTGVEWRRHEVCVGFVRLWSKVDVEVPVPEIAQNVPGRVVLGYWNLSYEYLMYKHKRWELDFPMLAVGMGVAGVGYKHPDPLAPSVEKRRRLLEPILILEPSFNVFYRFMPYTHIGGGLGYRFAFAKDKNTQMAFNAPIMMVKIKVEFGRLYRGWRKSRRK